MSAYFSTDPWIELLNFWELDEPDPNFKTLRVILES